MERNISKGVSKVKFKVLNETENSLSKVVNLLFVISYCILAIVAVYFFIINPSVKLVFIFIGFFVLLSIVLDLTNGYLNTEYVEFKLIDKKFIITKVSEYKEFNINECKMEYHVDKTDWIELNCENQKFTFSLARQPNSNLLNIINRVNQKVS
jgi:hypothetical protein